MKYFRGNLMPGTVILLGQAALVARLERHLPDTGDTPTVRGWIAFGHAPTDPKHFPKSPRLGHADQLESIVTRERPGAVLISLPGVMSEAIRTLRTRLRKLGIADRYMPPLEDQLSGIGPRTELWIDPATLLGRTSRPVDETMLRGVVGDRRVLITGAGGSIGSELARQVATRNPSSLILVDRSENALFEIDRQIAMEHPNLPRRAVLHDVVDRDRTREIFARMRPDIVFHAAAHKHVPMMEDHPGAAIDNNLFGTASTLDASIACNAKHFVMISTDKAVRPKSVMGMTKRLAELVVRDRDRTSLTACSMVRFGNVLASSGSVLETWTEQVKSGGPITVTDRRMTRYFMTIPEAAALVAQAAALVDTNAAHGEVFVLDMGEPVSIDAFARRFVEAHGLKPVEGDVPDGATTDGVIHIVETGVRPGEKLHEDLGYDEDAMHPTRHPGINVWREARPDPEFIDHMLIRLARGRRPDDPRLLADELRSVFRSLPASFATGTIEAKPLTPDAIRTTTPPPESARMHG